MAEILNFEQNSLTTSELFALINPSNRQQAQWERESEKHPQIPLTKFLEAFICIEKALHIFEEFDEDEERVESTKKSITIGLKSY